jgi:hypothetical protein
MKKKLSLDLDALAVESFEIANDRLAKGTVRGHDVCSDMCTISLCAVTCGIMPASAESECNALPQTKFCTGETQEMSVCGPCCV